MVKYYICTLQEIYGWSEDKLNLIGWQASEEALRKQSTTRQTRLAWIIHNWQNVGTQKEKIEPTTTDNNCPTGCGMFEDHGHYLHCQHETMKMERSNYKQLSYKKWEN